MVAFACDTQTRKERKMDTKTITREQAVPENSPENVSPQVPSLETECDKQEVVEPEVLKPSDNKDCSKAEDTEVSEFRNWHEEMEKIA